MSCTGQLWKISRAAKIALVGVLLTGATRVADAGSLLVPAKTASAEPCLFTWQLQNMPEERERYALKLLEVLGRPTVVSSEIEQMYGNIVTAAYGGEKSAVIVQSEPALSSSLWQPLRPSGIDALSADCLGCHDGVGAQPVTTVLRNDPFASKSDRMLPGNDHPIGMDYDNYAAVGEYKSLSGVDVGMVFVNGKVGCLTCHNPLNPKKGHLVMSDMGSALCLTCHHK